MLFAYLIAASLCFTVVWWMRWISQAWSWTKR